MAVLQIHVSSPNETSGAILHTRAVRSMATKKYATPLNLDPFQNVTFIAISYEYEFYLKYSKR